MTHSSRGIAVRKLRDGSSSIFYKIEQLKLLKIIKKIFQRCILLENYHKSIYSFFLNNLQIIYYYKVKHGWNSCRSTYDIFFWTFFFSSKIKEGDQVAISLFRGKHLCFGNVEFRTKFKITKNNFSTFFLTKVIKIKFNQVWDFCVFEHQYCVWEFIIPFNCNNFAI